jgi:hypothetical protein
MAFTDTRIATALVLGEERALLNFGVNIPSGPTALDPSQELAVAQQITTHALAMTTTYFGGGLEVSSNLAAAIEAGNWILGASVGGVYKGNYVPVAGATKYRPGPEISVAIGFDRPLGERSRIFGDVGYTWYGKDQSKGQDTLQVDGKINFSLAGMWANEVWKTSFLLENRFKRKSPYALNKSLSVSYGNEFDFSTEVARQMSRDHALLAVTDLRIYGKNAAGVGEATVVSLGPGWRGRMAAPWQLEAIARFSAGRINESTIRGIELEIGMVFQL